MYGCESWTIKKAECRRIDAFELWCWRRLLRVPWTARRSVLGVHWKDWSWSWNYNVLATWCEELAHWKRPWCWARLKTGEGDDRRWDGWMASLTLWTWVLVGSGSWWWQGGLACCSPWGRNELDTTEWLNWTEVNLPLELRESLRGWSLNKRWDTERLLSPGAPTGSCSISWRWCWL